METKEFILGLIKALIWPVTILVIILLLRKQIKNLLNQLKSFKIKDAEFNFEKEIQAVKSQAKALTKQDNTDKTIDDYIQREDKKLKRLIELAELSPRGAILETWIELEENILEAGERNLTGCTAAPSNINKNSTHGKIMKDFNERGFISNHYLELYYGLKRIRNEAVHVQDKELSYQVCIEFINMAFELKRKLKNT
ncbi:MAG: hypothetical protein JXR82_01155 [Marinifilaceae bacterium]|nr:hypothetical protein [Marinifilaceae bacterium]